MRSRPARRQAEILHVAVHVSSLVRSSADDLSGPRPRVRSSRRPPSATAGTSSWETSTPAAFVANASPSTRIPSARAATASGTIDIPTTVAPAPAASASRPGSRTTGPSSAAYTPSRTWVSPVAEVRPRGGDRCLGELRIVHGRNVDERRRPVGHPPSAQRVRPHEVQVIAQDHERPGQDRRVQRPRRGGEDHRAGAELRGHARGERGHRHAVPLVEVHPALEDRERPGRRPRRSTTGRRVRRRSAAGTRGGPRTRSRRPRPTRPTASRGRRRTVRSRGPRRRRAPRGSVRGSRPRSARGSRPQATDVAPPAS